MERALSNSRVLPRLVTLGISVIALVVLALPVSASAADPAAAGPSTTHPEYTETILSNEQDFSRWAFVKRRVIAYSQPKNKGRKIRKLTTRTPDRTHDLVLVLRERKYVDGTVWSQVRVPRRGRSNIAWVRRNALDRYRKIRTRLEISRNRYKAKLYRNNKLVWSARIGIGKRGTTTPKGNFYIRNRLITTNSRGPYGPYAMGLSAYSKTLSDWPGGGIIGIHGTNQPGILPGRVSHGCIRVKNSKIRKLFRMMPAGTPVKIT